MLCGGSIRQLPGERSSRDASFDSVGGSGRRRSRPRPRAIAWSCPAETWTRSSSNGCSGGPVSYSPLVSRSMPHSSRTRRWRCGGDVRSWTSRTGRRAASRPAASSRCASTPRSCASTRRCEPVVTGRSCPKRRRWSLARRCANAAGRCLPWRSTRPGGRLNHCAPCAKRGPCWPTSWGWTPVQISSRWSRRSCARIRHCSPRRCPSPVPPARTGVCFRTESTTRTTSSGGTRTCRRACVAWRQPAR